MEPLVASSSDSRLRIAAINFLNPAPLMWDFEHEPGKSRLAKRYRLHSTIPADCAAELASGGADIGLIPAVAYAIQPSLSIVPGCAIASLDRVRSILLVVRADRGAEGTRTIATDTSSLTSYTYARVLFSRYWNAAAEFRAHLPNLDVMLASCDAALLIGDPALLALEDREAREQRTGERLEYLDLAHEWHTRTGLPWVSAFWCVRTETLAAAGVTPSALVEDFIASRDAGLAHIEDLVAEWSTRIAVPAATIRTYLTQNIHYLLDEPCLEGLRAFYAYAAEYDILPPVEHLRML